MSDAISSDVEVYKKPPALWIPVGLVLLAWSLGLFFTFNWELDRAVWVIMRDPLYSINALGAAFPLLLGVAHLVVSQFFRSQRNSLARRKVIIRYAIAAIAVLLLASVVG